MMSDIGGAEGAAARSPEVLLENSASAQYLTGQTNAASF